MSSIGEHIARVELTREDGRYHVVVTLPDGTVREPGSGQWTTIGAALDAVGRLIAGELHRRRSDEERVRLGAEDVP